MSPIDDTLEAAVKQHSVRLDDLGMVVYGDADLRVKGLLERTGDNERDINEMKLWRRDLGTWIKAIAALGGISALGTWWPYLLQFLRAWGG